MAEDTTLYSCREFIAALASAAPTPGGGGATALVGAVAAALGNMVGALTVGKKRYADVESEIAACMARGAELQRALLDQVRADAEGFAPLAAAYGLPKDRPDRSDVLEAATIAACRAPVRIMELCQEALELIDVFAQKGSRLALSDAGCAAACCRAALESASLNVFINTRSLQNRDTADALNAQVVSILDRCVPLADAIFARVRAQYYPQD